MSKQQRFVILMMSVILIPVLLMMVGNYSNSPMGQHGVYYNGRIIAHTDLAVIVAMLLSVWLFFLCGILVIMRSMGSRC